MSRSVYAIAAMALAVGGVGALMAEAARADLVDAAQAAKPATAATVQPAATAPSAPEATMHAPAGVSAPTTQQPEPAVAASPRIVVHTGAAPANAPDARVQVGDVKISLPSWSSAPAESEPVKTAGGITVPSNTLGPGEPLWRTTERLDAERRLAESNADFARAQAEQATRDVGHDGRFGYFGGAYYPRLWSNGYAGSGGGYRRRDGLRGPVTTTTTRSDQLGSTAQQAWADAAYPRLNGSTDARDAIVRQFGRDATPPIVRIQNDVDRAHNNANREHPR